jgi:hypothetical protein
MGQIYDQVKAGAAGGLAQKAVKAAAKAAQQAKVVEQIKKAKEQVKKAAAKALQVGQAAQKALGTVAEVAGGLPGGLGKKVADAVQQASSTLGDAMGKVEDIAGVSGSDLGGGGTASGPSATGAGPTAPETGSAPVTTAAGPTTSTSAATKPQERETSSKGFVLLPRDPPGLKTSEQPESDHWGLPALIDGLVQVGERWAAAHPEGPRIRIGDVSKKEGGAFPPHKSHTRGIDADGGLPRNDGKEMGCTVSDKAYSRELMRELMETFLSVFGDKFKEAYLVDPDLIAEYPGKIKSIAGHHNHWHLRING